MQALQDLLLCQTRNDLFAIKLQKLLARHESRPSYEVVKTDGSHVLAYKSREARRNASNFGKVVEFSE